MQPCRLVQAHKVILPPEMESGKGRESYYSWHEWSPPVAKVSQARKVQVLLNSLMCHLEKRWCRSRCLQGWKPGSVGSCQHAIILIPFLRSWLCHLQGVKGRGQWPLKRLLIFDIYHFNLPFSSPLPTTKKKKMWLSQPPLGCLAGQDFAHEDSRGGMNLSCSFTSFYY